MLAEKIPKKLRLLKAVIVLESGTQRAFAQRAGVDPASLSLFLSGRLTLTKIQLEKIQKALPPGAEKILESAR